ncbi:12234_t:CDS:2 [Gigaspora margarita]|uniref:12234_t:CDS:1 n=1 Tax=Gigaspora margarita TaxID=4874 RepID=A0ABN7U9R8_GIGMA|nr:12234_t:CDS:2 [Gigaspora margarita]
MQPINSLSDHFHVYESSPEVSLVEIGSIENETGLSSSSRSSESLSFSDDVDNWNYINFVLYIVRSETINYQGLDKNDILKILALSEDDLQILLEESVKSD